MSWQANTHELSLVLVCMRLVCAAVIYGMWCDIDSCVSSNRVTTFVDLR